MKAKISLHEQQLNDILTRVEVLDEKTYLINKTENKVYQQQPYQCYTSSFSTFGSNNSQNKEQLRSQLIQHLGNTLYSHFYCGIPNENINDKYPSQRERNEFMELLSKSNYSTDTPDKNWEVYSIDANGEAFARKNDELRPVLPNTYVQNPSLPTIIVNQKIDFLRQKENRTAQPVFYYVYGNEYLSPDCDMIRFYWNIKPEGAPVLIEHLTKIFNDYRIPFQFKCLNHPTLYKRNDSAVLYINKMNFSIAMKLLKSIIELVRSFLINKSPLFTDILDTGICMAEDPGDGQSFGMNRVNAIAQAIVEAFEENKLTIEERGEWVKKSLSNSGISYQRMSINPLSIN